MSTLTVNGSAVKKMTFKDSSGKEQKVKKWYHNDVKVFSSGNICTYYVDTGDLHTEEIDGEESCLTPKTFTPSKTGYIFVGWREDNTASSSVLSEKAMGEDPISLYAVFKKSIEVTFNGNGATSGSVNTIYASLYYNNGNVLDASIVLPVNEFTRTNYIFTKWNLGSPGETVTISSDTNVLAQWISSAYGFNYTGSMQSFVVPVTGVYQLYVYGAQGGTGRRIDTNAPNSSGGAGGSASGCVTLTAGTILYICVGGLGQSFNSNWSLIDTGYNGGGVSGRTDGEANGGGGGGATHIGTRNGTLAQYGNTSGLLIAAGGGGGGGRLMAASEYPGYAGGGTGGGVNGGNGIIGNIAVYKGGVGGTQSGGYAFGAGQPATYSGGGGGGGLYGGNRGSNYAGGGGGSGYIGGLTNATLSNGVRYGNGYAEIQILSVA